MDAYALVKFLHVLLAVLPLGFNNPAYGLLLLTGLALVVIGNLPLTTLWIAGALVLWAILVAVGLGMHTPTLRRQIRTLDAGGAGSAEYRELASRNTFVGIPLGVIALAIVFLMVVKPTL